MTNVGKAGQELVQVTPEHLNFRGKTLDVIRHVKHGWAALKRICEALGLDEEAQRKRLLRAPWAVTSIMEVTGPDGKNYETICLRIDCVPMWLATIQTSRIKDPAARAEIEAWQREATEVLNLWFFGAPVDMVGLTRELAAVKADFAALLQRIEAKQAAPRCALPQPRRPEDKIDGLFGTGMLRTKQRIREPLTEYHFERAKSAFHRFDGPDYKQPVREQSYWVSNEEIYLCDEDRQLIRRIAIHRDGQMKVRLRD